MTNLEKETREYREKLRRDAELMEGLIAHPGWERFRELVETVGSNYFQTVCAPLDNVFEVTKSEYAKGTLNGLTLATQLPRSKIEESKNLRGPSEDEEGN